MGRVPNARIRKLCGMKKRLAKRIEKGENDRIPKRVYVEECDGSRSVGRSRK